MCKYLVQRLWQSWECITLPPPFIQRETLNIMYVWKPWKTLDCFPKYLQALFVRRIERSVRAWGSLLVETKNTETIWTEIAIMMYISAICGTVLEVDPWNLIWLRYLAQFELKQEGAVLRCHQQTQICMTTTFSNPRKNRAKTSCSPKTICPSTLSGLS